jgi:hypothetical protein
MDSNFILRSRLLLAVGLGSVAPAAVLSCGGETGTGHQGSGAGSAGEMAAAGTGGGAGTPGAGGSTAGASSGGAGGSVAGAGAGGGGFCEPWPACITIRRPFMVGTEMRSSDVAERADWLLSISPVDIQHPRTREFLAASWLKDALEEHASVAAFARFTMLMLSFGAPPELIIASQRASLDEVQHARACFALARRYGSRDVGPSPLHVADSLSVVSLSELVALTVAEGCVGETLGALLATEQLERAHDPEVRKILRRIAKDEARHAELAWKFLAWALESGDTGVQTAAHVAFRNASDEIERMRVVDYGVDVDLWHAHGRLTCAEARELSRVGLEQVVRPCFEALIGRVRKGNGSCDRTISA